MALHPVDGYERQEILALMPKTKAITLKGQLRALRRFFEDHKWTRGALVKSNAEPAFCLEGAFLAIGLVDGQGTPWAGQQLDFLAREQVRDVILALASASGDEGFGFHQSHIPSVNDSLPSKAALFKVIDRAIEDSS